MPLESTGERFLPEWQGEIAAEHLHRYLFASEYTRGADVLDIASGEGYGSNLLADHARRVVGVDISADAVAHAQARYRRENLAFLVGAAERMPLADAQFDLVCCFETLEHLEDHDAFLGEVRRVLRPNGLLIISSPDKTHYSLDTGYTNPFHRKELTNAEFADTLDRFFRFRVIGGQRAIFGSALQLEDAPATAIGYLREADRFERAAGVPKALYRVALASDAPLPPLRHGVLVQDVTTSDAFRSVAGQYARELDEDERALSEQKRALAEERGKLAAATQQVDALQTTASSLRQALAALEQDYASLFESHAALRREIREIVGSRTWRLSRPLRAGVGRFRTTPAARLLRRLVRPVLVRSLAGALERPGDQAGHARSRPLSPSQRADIEAEFDTAHYLSQFPLVQARPADPIAHYAEEGWRQGLDPAPWFSTAYYLARYTDIRDSALNPFWHYVRHGRKEGRLARGYSASKRSASYQPLVSAVVTNYNHARYLRQRVDSILQQTYRQTEVIILDDASSDDSIEVISGLQDAYPGAIRLIRNEVNSGSVFRQWRRAFEAASGELIWICESDDFADPNLLAELTPCFADPSVMIAFGRIQFANADGSFRAGLDDYREHAEAGIWDRFTERFAATWFRGAFGAANIIPNVGGSLIRRQELSDEAWSRAAEFKVVGDWYLYILLAAGGRIAYVPTAVSYFRQHERNTSVSSFTSSGFYREHEEIITLLRSRWGTPDSVVRRFSDKLRQHFSDIRAATALGSFSAVFDPAKALLGERVTRHILIASYGFHLGGGEIFPIDLANALVQRGFVVSLLVVQSREQDRRVRGRLDPRVAIYEAELLREIGIQKLIADAGIDLLHSHSIAVEFLLLGENPDAVRIPYVVTLHGSYEVTPLERRMRDRLQARVDHWVYLTERNLSHLDLTAGTRHGPLSISHISNSAPVDPRPFPSSRADLGIPADAVVFSLVSRAMPEKGWEAAIHALNAAQSRVEQRLVLLLCGSGDEAERLAGIYGSNPNVKLLGFQERVQGLYRLSDCALLPTRFRGESFPLTLIEAMQVGAPVIATDVGSIARMVVEGGTRGGILVEPHEDDGTFVAAVADAMVRMADAAFRRARAADAKILASRFSMDRTVDAYVELYERLLAPGRSGVHEARPLAAPAHEAAA